MRFSKYEATGNDFIMLDGLNGEPSLDPGKVRWLCDRHSGVGADGVIVLLPGRAADMRMRIFNADGSEAEMCGNGLRALALFALDEGMLGGDDGRSLTVETAVGPRTVTPAGKRAGAAAFTVDMGVPAYERSAIPMEGPPDEKAVGVDIEVDDTLVMPATCVSMGNPHCVFFVDDMDAYPVQTIGPAVEVNPLFPNRTNVEFARVIDASHLEVRVWERGVGETLACGTGACAAVVAATLDGLVAGKVTVSLPGGDLEIVWDGGVRMTGPARRVFIGETAGERGMA